MTELRIHFEGDAALRMGFHAFFGELRQVATGKGIAVKFVAAGGQPGPYFAKALRAHPQAWNVLLLDSDRPDDGKLFARFQKQYRLPASLRDSVFWMVHLMEAWFLADPEALAEYYGRNFNRKALKKNRNVEKVPKVDVESCLKQATESTGRTYEPKTRAKTLDAPKILAVIDPEKVRAASQNCDRLFRAVLAKLDEG